jgi:membrane protein YqaA with SNARE-associated domain
MPIPAQFVIPESLWTWIQGLGRLGLIRLGVVMLGLVVVPGSVWTWIQGLGGLGLILLGLADNAPFVSAPPGSEDVFLILLSAHHPKWWVYYAFMATVGEVLGGYLGYRLASKGGQETFEKKVGKPRAETIYEQFEKRGYLTVFSGSILPPPFPFSPVVMAAGVMQYPRKKFLSALLAGRASRFLVVAFLGRVYGRQMIGFFSHHYRTLLYVLISVVVIAGIGALVYFIWYRPSQQRGEGGRARPAGRKKQSASDTAGVG